MKVSDSAESCAGFTDFLHDIEDKCDRLFILGDLFTYWYEHSKIDFYSGNPALKAIKEFGEKGKKVYFTYGNRDFAAGEYFRRFSGAEYMGDDYVVEENNLSVYLTHGDAFAKKDIRYQLWKMLIRSSIASFVFKNLPVGFAISLADSFKKVGKNRPAMKKALSDMIINGAYPVLRKGYDAVIAGHAHMRAHRSFEIDGRTADVYILSEFEYPDEFLVLENGVFRYEYIGGSR
ncbi:MAG: metallophosphoesterase [Elusimicrobia bacterium]|nr:metallophosphoesterase [Elusimicrobiota bacterium]